jgi:yeast amino acid transporter
VSICIAFLRFRKAQQVQGFDQREVGFKSRFQPYAAWFTLIFFTVILIFNGFPVFLKGRWSVDDFLVAYIGIP